MDENQQTDPQVEQLFDTDLSKVDTSNPLLPKATYVLTVKDIKVQQNAAKTGQVLSIVFSTTAPTTSTTGVQVAPGWPIYHTIGLTPSEKRTKEHIDRDLASFMEAALGRKGKMNPLDQFKGKSLKCSVDIEPERDGWPAKNRIKSFVINK